MARPAWTYRGSRRVIAKRHKLIWRHLDRVESKTTGAITVRLPETLEVG